MPASLDEGDPALQRWLMRYGVDNAYGKWRVAGANEASLLAFTAIAAEPRILMRLPSDQARSLAYDAYLTISRAGKQFAATPGQVAATRMVKDQINAWQRYVETGVSATKDEPAAPEPSETVGIATFDTRSAFDLVLDDFPQVRTANAEFLVDTVCRLGTKGLLALGRKADSIFALGAARVAARSYRGKPSGYTIERERYMQALQTVQEWGQATGRNAFCVPGYPGRRSLTDRVLSLARDANACADLAAQLPGGAADPGFAQWEDAEEMHGYAMLCLRSMPFQNLDYDLVVTLASAAGRLAQRAVDDPDVVLPVLPDLPEHVENLSPRRVMITALGMCQGTLRPRRSGAA